MLEGARYGAKQSKPIEISHADIEEYDYEKSLEKAIKFIKTKP